MDIFEFLAKHGIEVGDESREDFRKSFFENFKTASELSRKAEQSKADKARIAELESQVEELNGNIAKLDGESGTSAQTIKELQDRVAAYEQAEAERKAAAKAKADRDAFDGFFAETMRGFSEKGLNIKEGLYSEQIPDMAYKMQTENPAMSLPSIVDALAKQYPDMWANPQREPHKMPTPGKGGEGDAEKPKFKTFF